MSMPEPTGRRRRRAGRAEAPGAPVPELPERDSEVPEGEPEIPSPELGVAFTPRQILGGFALIAGLILLLVRRRRRPGRSSEG